MGPNNAALAHPSDELAISDSKFRSERVTLLSNIWIISPTEFDSQCHHAWLLPALSTIIFAISEPLYIFLLVRVPLEPAYYAFMVPVTQALVSFALWETKDVAAPEFTGAAKNHMQQAKTSNEARYEAVMEGGSDFDPVTVGCGQGLGRKTSWIFAFAHLQTAAATTASLLLLAQNADNTKIESAGLHVFLVVCALVYFGLSRLADLVFARYVQLPCYFGQNGAGDAKNQVENLLWLTALRSVVKVALDMDAISGPFRTDGAGVEYFVDGGSIHRSLNGIFWWAWCAVCAACVCLMALGGTMKRRAEADTREGRLD